ncbi:hypothetical protein MHYP_G00106680 [Metynnis hypsauchen]
MSSAKKLNLAFQQDDNFKHTAKITRLTCEKQKIRQIGSISSLCVQSVREMAGVQGYPRSPPKRAGQSHSMWVSGAAPASSPSLSPRVTYILKVCIKRNLQLL